MKKPLTLTLPLVLAAFATGGVAIAQSAERPARGAPVTREQATATADRAFERLDANKDGKLDQADHAAHERAMFERLDADGNGAVTLAEFQAARAERHEARSERGKRGRGGHAGMARLDRLARTADANSDGSISQAEFRSAALARFEAADANNDGTVTPEERRGARGMRRGGPAG